MSNNQHNPQCFANHTGLWLAEPMFLQMAVADAQAGRMLPNAVHDHGTTADVQCAAGAEFVTAGRGAYVRYDSGVAVVHIAGAMMKGESKYGGTSTIATRQALRAADDDAAVTAIMLAIDSPGGHTAGTQELADVVASLSTPCVAHADDLCASAAYWVASQASGGISINRTGEIGSIGTVASVADMSGAAEKEGIKVHVISTGEHKGAFTPGAPITEEHLSELQDRVNRINEHFIGAVMSGRDLSRERVDAFADGRVFGADQAMAFGMIDRIQSFDEAFTALESQYGRRIKSSAGRGRMRAAEIMLDI